MEIIKKDYKLPQKCSLILGFFDGIHIGHKKVIENTLTEDKIIVTFNQSPADFFKKTFKYIYSRDYNYNLIKNLGVKYIYEKDFSELYQMSASDYLKDLINKFNPISITTGFNHTFGYNKAGNSDFLIKNQENFKYINVSPIKINNTIVSSTFIKNLLTTGAIEKANQLLTRNFSIQSKVIEGKKIGRTIGFPTANMKYPNNIIKIPYGVYKVEVLDKIAVMNWGIKPTFNSEEIIEVFIPSFEDNLYNRTLDIKILKKIRDEKKFNNLEELKAQISKDVAICLK